MSINRRGFLGLFGRGAAAAAFVPFVVPSSAKVVAAQKFAPAGFSEMPPAPAPTKGAKVWMFGSIYDSLRVQITPERAVQFYMGRYWTDEPEVAGAVRMALKLMPAGYHHSNLLGLEIKAAEDLVALQKARKRIESERVPRWGE